MRITAAVKMMRYHKMRLDMSPKISACIKITVMAVVVAVCWVAGCAKKSGREAVPETRDTLPEIPNTLSEVSDTPPVSYDTLTDKRDGQTYKTVTIGKQIWMAENLNYATSRGSWCYGDDSSNCDTYGRLYNWNTAMAVCPSGWHLPSNQEWETLVNYVGGSSTAGTKLKSASGRGRGGRGRGGNGTDDFDFSALPGGYHYYSDGSFSSAGNYGVWWTATEYGRGYDAYLRGMLYRYEGVNEYGGSKNYGFSVRCVRDKNAADASSQKSVGDDKVGIKMVFVKGGTFMMGCTNEQGSDCDYNEKPTHSVTVSDFYICKYEVTQNQWVQVMGGDNNQSYFKGDNLPVETVNWNAAQEFILRLNTMTGKKYRLPTEAEWEYAARGGTSSKRYKYSGSNNGSDVAWYYVNSGDKVLKYGLFEEYNKKNDLAGYSKILDSNKNRTRAVGTKAPNELGIYDMSGNVWEWVNDWSGVYSSAAQTNPQGTSLVGGRGGGWDIDAGYCRVSKRSDSNSDNRRYNNIGFCLALSP